MRYAVRPIERLHYLYLNDQFDLAFPSDTFGQASKQVGHSMNEWSSDLRYAPEVMYAAWQVA